MRRNRTHAAWPESSNDRAAGDPLERRFLPTPDEILADPLVRTVLDVFEGEVKRIHPRQRPSGE